MEQEKRAEIAVKVLCALVQNPKYNLGVGSEAVAIDAMVLTDDFIKKLEGTR